MFLADETRTEFGAHMINGPIVSQASNVEKHAKVVSQIVQSQLDTIECRTRGRKVLVETAPGLISHSEAQFRSAPSYPFIFAIFRETDRRLRLFSAVSRREREG